MKFLLIVAVAIIGLVFNQVTCDLSSSSSEVEEGDSGAFPSNNELLNLWVRRHRTVIRHYIPHRPPLYPPHGNDCQMCMMIVNYVNQYGGSSPYTRNTAMHNACPVVGITNIGGCQNFVLRYGQQLVPFLHPGSDPIGTCRLIHVC